MDLHKARRLRGSEYQGTLYEPPFVAGLDEDTKKQIYNVEQYIQDNNTLYGVRRSTIVTCLEERFDSLGMMFLRTEFAKGFFFRARRLFKDRKYCHVYNGMCFDNAYTTALCLSRKSINNKVLNGVFWCGFSCCHSVNLVNDKWIIDYNFDIVMEKDLYMKTFPFDVVEIVDGKTILEEDPLIDKYGVNGFERMFCRDVIVNQVKAGEIEIRRSNDKIFLIEFKDDFFVEHRQVEQKEFENKFVWPEKLMDRTNDNNNENTI